MVWGRSFFPQAGARTQDTSTRSFSRPWNASTVATSTLAAASSPKSSLSLSRSACVCAL